MNAYPAAHFNPSSATQPGPRAGLPATPFRTDVPAADETTAK